MDRSSSSQGQGPGGGTCQRVSILITYEGQPSSHKIRLPVSPGWTVKDVKDEVGRRAKTQELVPETLELKHLMADDAILCDTDAFEDAWEPGEALKAIFVGVQGGLATTLPPTVAANASATSGITSDDPSAMFTVLMKRLTAPAVELRFARAGADTIADLRQRLMLVYGWDTQHFRLVFAGRGLGLDECVQSLRKPTEDVLTIFLVPQLATTPGTGVGTEGSLAAAGPMGSGDRGVGKNVSIKYRTAESQDVKTVEVPAGSSVNDLLAALRLRLPSPAPSGPAAEGGVRESWRPSEWSVSLSHRHYAMSFSKPASVEVDELGLEREEGPLYVTVYGAGKEGAYTMGRGLGIRPAWVPFQCQDMSEAGMACFLSTLYVVLDVLKTRPAEASTLLARFRRLCGRFHPAVLSLSKALRRRTLTDPDAGSISSAFYTLLRALVPPPVPDNQLFTHARTGFYVLLRRSAVAERVETEAFQIVNLRCPLTGERLQDPVSVVAKKAELKRTDPEAMDESDSSEGVGAGRWKRVFSRAAVQTVLMTHEISRLGIEGDGKVDMISEPPVARLLRLTHTNEGEVLVWDEPEGKLEAAGKGRVDGEGMEWEELCLMISELPYLRVIPPLSLVKVGGERICLTVDQKGLLAVYLGRPSKCPNPKHNTQLWRPTVSGGETSSCDRNEVAAALAELTRTLGISLAHLGIEEEGPPDEGIVVLLDVSRSMTEFVSREEERGQDGGGSDSDISDNESTGDSDDSEEEKGEGVEHMDLDDVNDPFPDATDIACPPELMCPLTRGILLDPVMASDGTVYERAALMAWLLQRERSARRGLVQSPVGRGMLNPDVEARYDAETARRVMYWLQHLHPWVLEQPDAGAAAAGGSSSGQPASSSGPSTGSFSTPSSTGGSSSADPPNDTPISITLETRWLKPVVLTNLCPRLPLSSLLPRIRRELGLNLGGLAHCPLSLRLCRYRPIDHLADQSLEQLKLKDGSVLNVEPRGLRPGLLRERALSVVHIHGYEIPTEDEMPRASFLVRTNVPGRVLKDHVDDLGVAYQSKRRWALWGKMVNSGDGMRTGWILKPSMRVADFERSHFRANECLRLQVTGKPAKPPRFKDGVPLKRIEVVKQLFEAFVNRTEAYDYSHHMGLVLFGSTVNEVCSLTPVYEDFRGHIERAQAKGDTCLYDAIKHGTAMLQAFHTRFPTAKRRLLVLSDGEDSGSEAKAFQVASDAQKEGIVIDSVIIGPATHKWLLAISKATSGYCFQPKTLREALKLNELETLLSVSTRPPSTARLAPVAADSALLSKYGTLPLDMCNDTTVPEAAQHPSLGARVTTLSQAIANTTKTQEEREREEAKGKKVKGTCGGSPVNGGSAGSVTTGSEGGEGLSSAGLKRVVREMMALQGADAHPAFTIYPCEDDVSFWRMLLQGPSGSLYEGGVWMLYLQLPQSFPLDPPKVRFVTPILHTNVNCYGRICHSVLGRDWTSDQKLSTVLGCIYGLLLNPDTSDPLDTDLAAKFYSATGEYEASIMTHTELHAKSKSLEQWKKDMEEGLGGGEEDEKAGSAGKKRKSPDQSGRSLRSSTGGKK